VAIGGIGATAVGAAGAAKRDRDETRTRAEPASKSRALVAIAAPAGSTPTPGALRRPLAAFLAQLIATETNAPQTRARRRAEPQEALAIYQVGRLCGRLASGSTLRRDA